MAAPKGKPISLSQARWIALSIARAADANRLIARLEDDLADDPDNLSLQINIDSLRKHRDQILRGEA